MTRRALSEAGPARGAVLRKASRSLAALQTSPHERRGEGPSAAGGAGCHAKMAGRGPHTWEGIDTNHPPVLDVAISRPFMSSNAEPRTLRPHPSRCSSP